MMLSELSSSKWPPPQKIAAVPVPSVGLMLVVAEPAITVTLAEMVILLPDVGFTVVTRLSAGPVALSGTLTIDPAGV